MLKPLDIRYRHMSPSPALTASIEAEVNELERICDQLVSCSVTIEQPSDRHRQGNKFRVLVDLHVGSTVLVVGITHDDNGGFECARTAVTEQFSVVRRRLQQLAERRRGHTTACAPGSM